MLFFALYNATLFYYFFNNIKKEIFNCNYNNSVFKKRNYLEIIIKAKSEHSIRLVICSSILDVFDCMLSRILEKQEDFTVSVYYVRATSVHPHRRPAVRVLWLHVCISIYSHAYSLSSRMR